MVSHHRSPLALAHHQSEAGPSLAPVQKQQPHQPSLSTPTGAEEEVKFPSRTETGRGSIGKTHPPSHRQTGAALAAPVPQHPPPGGRAGTHQETHGPLSGFFMWLKRTLHKDTSSYHTIRCRVLTNRDTISQPEDRGKRPGSFRQVKLGPGLGLRKRSPPPCPFWPGLSVPFCGGGPLDFFPSWESPWVPRPRGAPGPAFRRP